MDPDLIHMRLQALRLILDGAGAQYEIISHPHSVHSAGEGALQGFGTLEEMAPAFLLQTERGWLCAILSGERRLAYRLIRKQLGIKDAALAKPADVERVTGAPVGAVSLVNPGLPTLIDAHLTTLDTVYGGCGVPCHTLRIRVADLVAVTQAEVFEFSQEK